MKKRFGRKSLALVLALSIESGSIPIKPVDDLFGVMPVKARLIFDPDYDPSIVKGTCGENATWVHDLITHKLTISGTGNMYDYVYNEDLRWRKLFSFSDIESVEIENGITSIGDYAFESCNYLTSITIPDSVSSIGDYAFYDCTGLTSISIPDSVTSIGNNTFSLCENLTSITIPDSVSSIGDYAFFDCTSLTSISIPDSVTSIGINAFRGCKSITDVYCYADPAKLTWNDGNCDDFITSQEHTTVCHVPAKYLAGYKTKFGDSVNVTFKGMSAVTAPTANTLSYNSNEHELVSAGSTDFGTLLYSLDGENYSTDIPKKTDAGTYTVYYKIDEDDYYFPPQTVEVTIADSYTITWKNGDEILETDNYVPGGAAPEYNGETPAKDATAQYTYSFIGWSDGTNTYAPDELPSVSSDVIYTAQFDSTARIITGTCGENATWELDPSTGKLTISGTGAMDDYDSFSDNPWIKYQSYITSVEIDKGITYIGKKAFLVCLGLTSISIPDSVSSIGDYAFDNCKSLSSVTIPDSVSSIGDYAFEICTSLTSVTLPDSITSIGNNTFAYCENLTSITIPDNVTSIGNNAFYNCKSLSSITIPDSVKSIGVQTFALCESLSSITIPDSITNIDGGAFAVCTSLSSITIPGSVTSIGSNAFAYCTGLTSITIPDSVTSIGDSAFAACTGLTSISISDSITSIDDYAFRDCKGLTSITIPDSVTSIGIDAFHGCKSITDVYCYADPAKLTWNDCNCDDFIMTPKHTTVCHVPAKYLAGYNTKFGDNVNVNFKGIPAPAVTAPTANTLSYNSNEQELVTAGSTDFGTLLYSIDGTNYSKDIPKGTDAGTYIVYYKVDEDDYYFAPQTVEVTIADSYTITWKNGDEILETDNFVPGGAAPEYNSTTPAKDATAEYTYSFIGWSDGTNTYAPDELPSVSGDVTYTAQFNSTARVITGKCGENATWELDPSTGKLTISGTGAMDDYASITDNPWTKYQRYITSVEIDKGITYIGKNAFLVCLGLTSISIPDSVTSIGNSAFSNCTSLTSISIPDSVTSIGNSAFSNCTSLTSISIPDSVSSIGNSAFSNCISLTSISIPDSVTSIGNSTFRKCTSLTSISIPDSVTSIGNSAFSNCTSLTSISIPDSVSSIGDYAFDSCTGLTSISIPDSVTSTGIYVFRECTGLTSISIPGSFTRIEKGAFHTCTSLTSISIPDNVSSIGRFAFAYCESLTSITIPDNVKRIEYDAFDSCTGLTSISIPDSVTSIEKGAFRNCTSLTSITIPDSVERISNDVFYNCNGITDVYCYADPAKLTWNEINCDDFIMVPKHTTVCHVPAKYLDDYKTKFGDSVNVTFKGMSAVTAPTANTLSYNSNEQELVTAGSTDFGTLLYSIDGTNYSKDIPKGTDAGTYIVYYKVDEDDYYFAPQTVEVTIADSYTITWKNGDEILETDNFVPGGAAPEYNGTTPAKDATAEYTYSFIGWSDGTNTYAPDELPSVSGDVTYTAQFDSTARDYIITYMVDGEVYDTKTESYGNAISLPDEPSREGYTFSGWQTSYTTMPAQNIEITGTFTKNQDDDPYVDVVQYGDDGDNHFKSGSGRDQLYGGGGNDVLDGGKGDDYLQGDHGDDTYIFRSGYGNDVISESSGNNTVKIYDYSADQMVTTRNAQNDLIIKFKNSEDTLTVTRFFDFNSNRDFNFEFENGTVIGQHDMPVHNSLITGTDENNYLNGTEINDIIDGGLGNDSLNGFGGEDTYIFGRGYGEDMINEWGSDHSFVDLKDINSDAVTVSDQWGSNLLISVNDSEDVLTVSNFKWGQASYTFRFADGAEGYVDRNTWELVLTKQPENNVIVIIE